MKRLYRSKSNSVIGGVAGGIAEYFQIDPTVVRLVWIVAVFMGGMGILAYLIAWLVIPVNPAEDYDDDWHWSDRVRRSLGSDGNTRGMSGDGPRTFGLILVAIGLFLLARNFLPHFVLGRYWPVIIIGLGLWLVLSALRGEGKR